MRRLLRPPGLAVFAGVLVLVAALWWLFADRAVERAVETTGASLFGARVDLEWADVRPTEGSVALGGLQVANPDAPMRNLFEAEGIVADLRLEPLLQRKVVIERLSVTGVRFDTERTESGALENPDPEAGRLWREVDGWADGVRAPSLSLENLGGTIRTEAISEDSLATVRFVRRAASRADSMRTEWQSRLTGLDPRPRIDSIQAVAERLEAFQPSPANALRLPGLLRDGRGAIDRLTRLEEEVAALDDDVRAGLASLRLAPGELADLRDQDLRYAVSLLDIPSLDAPSISPALFHDAAMGWLRPALHWTRAAERFLPPGLDPRRRPGPSRARAEGTTFDFREGAEYPSFLLEEGELGVLLATGAAAGSYSAVVRNLTSSPSLLGRPMEMDLSREEATVGPQSMRLHATLDHTGDVPRDSVGVRLAGVELPEVDLGGLGGTLSLGSGVTALDLRRDGDALDARLVWRSDAVSWTRTPGQPATESGRDALPGSPEWARDFVWRTLTNVSNVEVEMALSGSLERPSLAIRSNLGEVVSGALQQALGEEIDRARTQVRAEIDQRIQPHLTEARDRADEVRAGVGQRVTERRAEIEELRTRLEERVAALTRIGG